MILIDKICGKSRILMHLFFITILTMSFATAHGADNLQKQALDLANKEIDKYAVLCGNAWYGRDDYYVPYVEMKRKEAPGIKAYEISESDRLNGLEWNGYIVYKFGPARRGFIQSNRAIKWQEWRDSQEHFTFHLQRKNGQWIMSARDFWADHESWKQRSEWFSSCSTLSGQGAKDGAVEASTGGHESAGSSPGTSMGGIAEAAIPTFQSTGNSPKAKYLFSMGEILKKINRGNFKTDNSISVMAAETAADGAVVPFFINLSTPIGAGDRLVVIVNDKYPAYLAMPLRSVYLSQLSGRVKIPSGAGSIRAIIVDSKGGLKSSTKNLNVIAGVQSFDSGEESLTNPTFRQVLSNSSGITEIKLLITSPSSLTSFINSTTTEFSDGEVTIFLTSVASKNPFVSFKVNRPANPGYRITVKDNRGGTSTSEGQAY